MTSGTDFDQLIDRVYAHGDETGIKVDYCRPELDTHLYGALEEATEDNRLTTSVKIGLTEDGEVKVFTDTESATSG